jgi:predicted DNA-binding transcriptional regulator AlpA
MSDNELTMRDLCARFNVERWTIHRWIRDLEFPKGRLIPGRRGRRWATDIVDQWDALQEARAIIVDAIR